MKVTTFGEALFRTVTERGQRLLHTNRLHFYLGGSELNIAANLHSLGVSAQWIGALPGGLTGELIREKTKMLGVHSPHCIQLLDNQIGWYLMESGEMPRPDVVFHRNSSAMAKENHFSFDWDSILQDVSLFHTSGITTGLSHVLTNEVKKILSMAKKKNILVSYDINFRKNIWSLEESINRQKELLNFIDLLFCSKQDLKSFFNTNDFSTIFKNSNLKILILTERNHDHNEYYLHVVSQSKEIISKKYKINCIDRIGVGDSAAAGFIKAYLNTHDIEKATEWGALAGALKYGISGDMALLKESELQNYLEPTYSGIIR
jgi:2-dehydro-3-deoxygluconokinase